MPLPALLDLASWSVKERAAGIRGLGVCGFSAFADDGAKFISPWVGRGRMLNICAPWVGVDLLVGGKEKAEGRDAASHCGHCESGDV